jgi:hypothetical protein
MINELLVLGQIPGTNIQITFNEFLMILDLVVIIVLTHKHLPQFDRIRRAYYLVSLYIYFKRSQRIKLSI